MSGLSCFRPLTGWRESGGVELTAQREKTREHGVKKQEKQGLSRSCRIPATDNHAVCALTFSG